MAAWLARAQGDQARGDFVDPRAGRITLAAFAERFLAERVLADRTRETYRGLLDGHLLPTLGGLDIGQLAPGTVRGWYARLARAHPSTAAQGYRLLRTMMNTAVADELILRNPCCIDGAGRESAPERPIATLAELELLVTAMPARFRAMILLACWCHLRKAELCARLDSERVRRPVRCAGRAGDWRRATAARWLAGADRDCGRGSRPGDRSKRFLGACPFECECVIEPCVARPRRR